MHEMSLVLPIAGVSILNISETQGFASASDA